MSIDLIFDFGNDQRLSLSNWISKAALQNNCQEIDLAFAGSRPSAPARRENL
jgi:hypothetical protein